jgi:hypothetical protein
MSYEFVIYVSDMTEDQADDIAGRWPETTSGARVGREYIGFTRQAGSLGEAIDQAIVDLKTVGIEPLKVEADWPCETVTA